MHIWLYIIVIIIIVDLLLTIERRCDIGSDSDNDTRDIYELKRSRFNLLTILCANVKSIYL